jgi:hypothetical protein
VFGIYVCDVFFVSRRDTKNKGGLTRTIPWLTYTAFLGFENFLCLCPLRNPILLELQGCAHG